MTPLRPPLRFQHRVDTSDVDVRGITRRPGDID